MRWYDVTQCEYCGDQNSSVYLRSYVPNWYEKRPLTLVECNNCRLVRASPRPDPDDLYVNYISGGGKAKEIAMRKLARDNVGKHHRRAIESAMSFARRPVESLFDIGCGAGTLMMEGRALGIEAEGNDLNKAAIDHLKELGFNAYLGFTQNIDFPRTYDMVMNLDYLEHSYEPTADLRLNFNMLNSGGVLYLKTLYLGCPKHVANGSAWGLFGNGHFHYFFPDTLRKMVESAGFEVAHYETKGLIVIVGIKP